MSYFRLTLLIIVLCIYSDGVDGHTVTDTTWIKANQKKIADQIKVLKESGQMSGFQKEKLAKQTKKYEGIAQLLANESVSRLEDELVKSGQLSAEQAKVFSPTQRTEETEEYAIFVSFSMPKSQLKEAFKEAADTGARVYLNGLHPEHKQINQTTGLLNQLSIELDKRPVARFNPKAFTKYNIKNVPTIMFRKKDVTFTASGLLNLRWIKGKAVVEKNSKDFGSYGPTTPVTERSLLEEIKERMAKIDFNAKKQDAINNFWVKKEFEKLPRATKDEQWFIDPTVKATNDVVNPRGDILARKGQVINPLQTMALPLTIIIFDALDNKQVEWVTNHLKSTQVDGQLMLLSSQFSREKGWKHVASLRKHFLQEIYLLPKEMISRFQLSGLPAKVITDKKSQSLKVNQYGIKELN